MMSIVVNSLIAIILAGMRIGGVVSKSFQAVAHIYVGVVFTAAYYSVAGRYYLFLGIIISMVELIVFLVTRKSGHVLPADH